MNCTDDFEDTLAKLTEKVYSFNTKTESKLNFSLFKKINLNSPTIYVSIIFFLSLIIFLVIRPGFVLKKYSDGNIVKKRISYIKLLISVILSTSFLSSLYYFIKR